MTRLIPYILASSCIFGLLVVTPVTGDDRPAATQLLPKETLAMLRVADSRVLADHFGETALGRISQEEQIRPLVAQLYGSAAKALAQVEDEVGLSLDKILALPQGEIVIALVAPPKGRPALVTLMDIGENRKSAETLLESLDKALAGAEAMKGTERYGDDEITIYEIPGQPQPLVHFLKDQTFVATTNVETAKMLLDVWEGRIDEKAKPKSDKEDAAPPFEPLSANQKYTAIMKRCGGSKESPAQLSWFVDPIDLARVASRGNIGAQAGLALLPALGLDGLEAVGGSVTFAVGDFDMVTHLHVLLAEPRSGVLETLALESGDTTPEPWVPSDAASYTTIYWDVDKTYSTIGQLFDSFRGEGQLSAEVQRRISEPLGVDLEKEILAALAGRFTYITWYERPARIGSEAALVGAKLSDPDKFMATLEKLAERFGDRLEKKSYGGVSYWLFKRNELAELPAADDPDVTDRQRRRLERRRRRQETFRTLRPSPCFAVMGDYLIVSDRKAFLEKVVIAKNDGSKALADELDFKLIASKIKRQVGGDKPGMITFSRPEEGMKVLYEMALGEKTRQQLASSAENNGFFRALDDALNDNPLPPFPVLAKYLAPGGGMVTNDATGFHYTGFVLRRK